MADSSSSASGSAAGHRSLLQRFRRWLRPGVAAQPRQLVSMRPTGATPYVGEIAIFAGGFAPAGWLFCHGQLLPISDYETLFQVIGTTYGGDGQETFALPDLRGRVPLHMGNGPGLGVTYQMGDMGGEETVTLSPNQIPSHTHKLAASTVPGTKTTPIGNVLADSGSGSAQYTQNTGSLVKAPVVLALSGGGLPHNNMQPCLAVNYIISLYGVFPSQN